MVFGSSGGDISVKIVGDSFQLESEFKKAGGSAKSFGDALKGIGTRLTAGVTAPLMVIGALALKSSSDVGGAFSTIRKKTNETGAAFESLKTSFKNVWGNVTGKAEDVASGLSLIHQRTGLTGKGLETLTTQFSQLAKITETPLVDVVEQATTAMNAWSIPTSEMASNLDLLYAVVGRTGVGITELTGDLATLQPTLQKFGFAFGPAASMIGDFEVAGLDATSMQKVFNKVINQATKDNKNVTTTFWEYIATLQNAKEGTKEYNAVIEDLGGTMGVKLVNAVKKGAFSFKNFEGDLQSSSDSIKRAAADTMSFKDVMEIFSHKVEIGMQPLGSAINKTFLDAKPQMDAFAGGVQELGKAFDKLPDSVKKGIVLTGMFAAQLGPGLMALGQVMPLFDKIGGAFGSAGGAAGGFVSRIMGIPTHLGKIGVSIPTKLTGAFTGAEKAAGGFFSTLKNLVMAPLPTVAVTGVSIPKIAPLLDSLRSSESAVARFAGKIMGLGPATLGVATGIRGWGSELKTAEGGVGKLKVGFTGLKGGLSGLMSGAKGLTSGIASGATGLLGMAGSVAGMVPLWAVVGGAVAAVGIGLGTAYATSSRFRSLMGELGGIASNFASHLGTAFSKLTSGDWKGAVNELKVGLSEAWQGIKKIDWRSALATIRTQMATGIISAWNTAVAAIKSVDWGGIGRGLKDMFGDMADFLKGVDWGGVAKSIVDSIGSAWDSIVGWFGAQDWHSIGQQAGNLIGEALVFAFKGVIDLGAWFAEALSGIAGGTAGTTAQSTGQSLGGKAKTGFGAAFAGVSEKIQEQLGRIHVDWGPIFSGLGTIFVDLGRLAGVGFITAFIAVMQPLLSALRIEIKTEGLISKAMSTLSADLKTYAGTLGVSVIIEPTVDATIAEYKLSGITNKTRVATILSQAETSVTESQLTAVQMKTRIATIAAAAETVVANSQLDATAKAQRIAEIRAWANTAQADANLNWAARTRTAEIIATEIVVRTIAAHPGGRGQHGMVVSPRPGGVPIIVGEAGEPELIVPKHDWGKPWGDVLSSMPRLQHGGIVGSSSSAGWYDPGVGAWRNASLEEEIRQMKEYEKAQGVSLQQIAFMEANIRAAYAQHYAELQQIQANTSQMCSLLGDVQASIQSTQNATQSMATDYKDTLGIWQQPGAWYDPGVGDWRRANVEDEVAAMRSLSGPGTNLAFVETNIRAAYASRGYARGGIAWRPQYAKLAENEPELIAPLSRIGSLIRSMLMPDFAGPQYRAPVDNQSQDKSFFKMMSRILQGANVDRRIYVNGVKADEIADEIQRKQHIEDLMNKHY